MTTHETSVLAALSEVHVYVHHLNEKSQTPSELGMAGSILLYRNGNPAGTGVAQLTGHSPLK